MHRLQSWPLAPDERVASLSWHCVSGRHAAWMVAVGVLGSPSHHCASGRPPLVLLGQRHMAAFARELRSKPFGIAAVAVGVSIILRR